MLLPLTLIVEGPPPSHLTTANVLGFAYLAVISSAVGYTLWFRGIALLSPTEVTFLGLLSPVTATTLGWLVLDQRLTAQQILGAAIVLASVVAVQIGGMRRRKIPRSPAAAQVPAHPPNLAASPASPPASAGPPPTIRWTHGKTP